MFAFQFKGQQPEPQYTQQISCSPQSERNSDRFLEHTHLLNDLHNPESLKIKYNRCFVLTGDMVQFDDRYNALKRNVDKYVT